MLKLGITREELENLLVESNREVKLNPNNADAYLGRAMVRHALKDYTGAIADYNQVSELPTLTLRVQCRLPAQQKA
ncbi:MAG: hypothetical protein HC815_31590 [Richelia sp. RM1_1_1]|nr:hypothetical protein [Richelia sp. RM1_1_1]